MLKYTIFEENNHLERENNQKELACIFPSLNFFYATNISFDFHVSPKLQIDLYLFSYEIS
jgi:hypothetical protein